MTKVHIGCGANVLPNWDNLDMEATGATKWCCPDPLPYADNSVDAIYSQHFWEHVPLDQGEFLLRECARVLKPGGVIRISTPDLKVLVLMYNTKNIRYASVVGFMPNSPADLLNQGMRLWGHQYIYDEEELTRLFKDAGFNPTRRKPGVSAYNELQFMESRPDLGDLILEAHKA